MGRFYYNINILIKLFNFQEACFYDYVNAHIYVHMSYHEKIICFNSCLSLFQGMLTHWTKKIIVEEGHHSLTQLVHMLQLLVRHNKVRI